MTQQNRAPTGCLKAMIVEANRQGWLHSAQPDIISEIAPIFDQAATYYLHLIDGAEPAKHEPLALHFCRYLFAKGVEGTILWGLSPGGAGSFRFDPRQVILSCDAAVPTHLHDTVADTMDIGESLYRSHEQHVQLARTAGRTLDLHAEIEEALTWIPRLGMHYALSQGLHELGGRSQDGRQDTPALARLGRQQGTARPAEAISSLIVARDLSSEWKSLPGSVRCVLTEAARSQLIPSRTTLFALPNLDTIAEEGADVLHSVVSQRMAQCASQGIPEQGLSLMRNACMVSFGKAAEAAILVLSEKPFELEVDPRRLLMPDLLDSVFYPRPMPAVCQSLAAFWSELPDDSTLDKPTLSRIGATVAHGAQLFIVHRDYVQRRLEHLSEHDVRAEMRSTLEWVFRIGVSFTLEHTLQAVESKRTRKLPFGLFRK